MKPYEPTGSFKDSLTTCLIDYATTIRKPTAINMGWQHQWAHLMAFVLFLQSTDRTLNDLFAPLIAELHAILWWCPLLRSGKPPARHADEVDTSSCSPQHLWKPHQAKLHKMALSAPFLRAIMEPRMTFFEEQYEILNRRLVHKQTTRINNYFERHPDPDANGYYGSAISDSPLGPQFCGETYRLNAERRLSAQR